MATPRRDFAPIGLVEGSIDLSIALGSDDGIRLVLLTQNDSALLKGDSMIDAGTHDGDYLRAVFELRRSVGEMLTEHRQAALGFSLRRLVLKYIPVLGENAAGNAAHVRSDPG